MSNLNTSPRGSNAANQDPEYLKRKSLQAWHLRSRLEGRVVYYEMRRDNTTGAEHLEWHNRMVRAFRRLSIVTRYFERLTAPAGGAE